MESAKHKRRIKSLISRNNAVSVKKSFPKYSREKNFFQFSPSPYK